MDYPAVFFQVLAIIDPQEIQALIFDTAGRAV